MDRMELWTHLTFLLQIRNCFLHRVSYKIPNICVLFKQCSCIVKKALYFFCLAFFKKWKSFFALPLASLYCAFCMREVYTILTTCYSCETLTYRFNAVPDFFSFIQKMTSWGKFSSQMLKKVEYCSFVQYSFCQASSCIFLLISKEHTDWKKLVDEEEKYARWSVNFVASNDLRKHRGETKTF